MTILFIDAAPLLFHSSSKLAGFTDAAGNPTGLRFGFMRSVAAAIKRHPAGGYDKTVIVFDGEHGPYPRSDLAGVEISDERREQIWEELPKLKQMLGLTSYTQIYQDGHEAPDMIGGLTQGFLEQGSDVVIYSRDPRLAPLYANPHVRGYFNKGFYDGGAIASEYGVPAVHVPFWMAHGQKSGAIKNWLCGQPERERSGHTGYSYEWYREAWNEDRPEQDFEVEDPEQVIRSLEVLRLKEPETMMSFPGNRDVQGLTVLFKSLNMKTMVPRAAEFAASTLEEVL